MANLPDEQKLSLELKAKWLAALRGGEFVQGESELCSRDRATDRFEHCCLGVLANVYGLENERLNKKCHLGDVGLDDLIGPWGDSQDKFSAFDEKTHYTLQRKLAGMNDSGKSFAEIADWIEVNL